MRNFPVCLGACEQLGIARATTGKKKKKDKGWQGLKLEQVEPFA